MEIHACSIPPKSEFLAGDLRGITVVKDEEDSFCGSWHCHPSTFWKGFLYLGGIQFPCNFKSYSA